MVATALTVLNVGADAAERAALTRAFDGAGFVVWEAESADQALNLAARTPDLIVLDLSSPGMPAFDVCCRLKESTATALIPVLYLGRSHASPQFSATTVRTNLADCYINRPVTPVEVVEIARESLRRKRQSELLSHRFFETATDAVVIVDATGTIVQLNSRTEWLFGYRRDELLNQPIELLVPEQTRDWHAERRCTYFANPAPRHMDSGFKGFARRKDGAEFPIDIALSPIETDSGRFVACAVRDVTRQRQLEGDLRQRTHELEDLNRHKDQFLATLAHELSSPLAAIAYSAELFCRSEVEPETRKEAAWIVLEETNFIRRLVQDLRELHRLQPGKVEVRSTPTDLVEVARLAIEVSRPLIARRRHTLDIDVPHEPIYLNGDDARLVQIITNLLNNAARYTAEGGRIRLSIGRVDTSAVLRVKDNGIGIPPEMLSRIFDLFTRLDGARSQYTAGMGIGLAFVRQLVTAQGGSVEALSEGEGKGSEFVVRLPLADRRS